MGSFDGISALLGVLALSGTGSPQATIRLITGMQKDTDDGWVTLVTFTTASTGNHFDAQHAQNTLLRYVRWELVTLDGGTPSVTFNITGMLRTNT